MRFDDGVARLQVGRQRQGDWRCLLAVMAAAFERQAHGVGMRHIAVESVADGGLELAAPYGRAGGSGGGDGAEVVAALGGADQQGLAGRRRLGQAIAGAVRRAAAFVRDQRLKMRGILDLLAFAVAARMGGEDVLAIDDAQPARARRAR